MLLVSYNKATSLFLAVLIAAPDKVVFFRPPTPPPPRSLCVDYPVKRKLHPNVGPGWQVEQKGAPCSCILVVKPFVVLMAETGCDKGGSVSRHSPPPAPPSYFLWVLIMNPLAATLQLYDLHKRSALPVFNTSYSVSFPRFYCFFWSNSGIADGHWW